VNLEDTIYYSCAAFTCIHPNRARALDHLFCVIGNGYEWENGELVEVCGMTTTKAGRRLSLRAAINKVFRERRKRDLEEKNRIRREKRKAKNRPPSRPQPDLNMKKLIADAVEAVRKAREKDPVAFEKQQQELKVQMDEAAKQWREDKKWDYKIPTDVKQRVRDTKFDGWYPISEKYSALLEFPDDIKPDWLDGVIETCNLIIAQPPAVREPHYPASQSKHTVALAKKALERALALRGWMNR
jgi:hypothetical protein